MTSPGSLTHGSSYRAVAARLAAAHRRTDPNIVKVYLALDASEREVRLIEVTTDVPTTMEMLPFRFAATADVPIVALFGPTLPVHWAPWRPARLPFVAIEPGPLPCRPCDQRVCEPGDFRCLRSIGAAAVIDAARKFLEGP